MPRIIKDYTCSADCYDIDGKLQMQPRVSFWGGTTYTNDNVQDKYAVKIIGKRYMFNIN